jgi:hypothetical protein
VKLKFGAWNLELLWSLEFEVWSFLQVVPVSCDYQRMRETDRVFAIQRMSLINEMPIAGLSAS